jgi:energy-coupling factor transporter ATP-binding protein EcfA2
MLGERPPWVSPSRLSETEPRYSSPYRDDRGEPILRVWRIREGAFYRLLYADGTEFFVDCAGTEVWATWPPESTLEDTATYLLGPILGLVLRLRGTVCLHASAVAVEGKAVALLGPAGAGKSTTAAAFAQLGYPIFSDDVVPLFEREEQILVQPAYPHLRLWPDSVNSLFGSAEALPRLTPTWDKRYYDLLENGERFQRDPLPLAAIYILGDRSEDPAAPFVEIISARDGLMTLVANTYVNYLLDKEMRAREFEMLSRVVRRVPVRRVRPHSNPSAVARLCQVILDDFRAMMSSAAPGQQGGCD